jgi:hypothetical protein
MGFLYARPNAIVRLVNEILIYAFILSLIECTDQSAMECKKFEPMPMEYEIHQFILMAKSKIEISIDAG